MSIPTMIKRWVVLTLLLAIWLPSGQAATHTAVSDQVTVDTLNPLNLTQLLILGPSTVDAGATYSFSCLARSSNGIWSDVTPLVTWNLSGQGSEPNHPRMNGPVLNTGNVPGQTIPVRISARYGTGAQTLTAYSDVTIQPIFSVGLEIVSSSYIGSGLDFLVTMRANSSGPNGPSVNTRWDLDDDGVADDAVGDTVESLCSVGSNLRRVVVEDSSGALATAERYITLQKPRISQEPEAPAVVDILPTAFWNAQGHLFSFDPARKANGLIILNHGLCNSANEAWIKNMAAYIEQRLSEDGVPLPNICIYDWSRMANPDQFDYGVRKTSCEGKDLEDFTTIRQYGLANGTVLADWIRLKIQSGDIDPAKKIQLIGHSAGGFVSARCAFDLKRTKVIDQITLLDTPFQNVTEIKSYQQFGGYAEFYLSQFGVCVSVRANCPSDGLHGRSWWEELWPPSGEDGHSYAHVWYEDTVKNRSEEAGFYYSPFLSHGFHGATRQRLAVLRSPASLAAIETTNMLAGFETFGGVVVADGVYTITEASNAGMFKSMTMPVGAQALQFRYRFVAPGDGDFLSVSWGTNTVMYLGLDLPISRDQYLDALVDVADLAGTTNTLAFILTSRGGTNAVVSIDSIALTESDDPDGDDLTTAQELILGTNPLLSDTDGDGLSDGFEVNTSLTNPLLADSDGDGFGDAQELAAGTGANNPASSLRIVANQTVQNGQVLISWSAETGKLYRIHRGLDLQRDAFDTLASGVTGVYPTTTFTDSLGSASSTTGAFYWVEMEAY